MLMAKHWESLFETPTSITVISSMIARPFHWTFQCFRAALVYCPLPRFRGHCPHGTSGARPLPQQAELPLERTLLDLTLGISLLWKFALNNLIQLTLLFQVYWRHWSLNRQPSIIGDYFAQLVASASRAHWALFSVRHWSAHDLSCELDDSTHDLSCELDDSTHKLLDGVDNSRMTLRITIMKALQLTR